MGSSSKWGHLWKDDKYPSEDEVPSKEQMDRYRTYLNDQIAILKEKVKIYV